MDGISNIWKSVSSVKEVLQSIAREKELFLLLSKGFDSLHIIVIDDLERVSDRINIEEVFGIVEELKKCNNVKIILVANIDELQENNKEIFKKHNEKVIDRIYHITEKPEKINWGEIGIHAGFMQEFLSVHKVKNLRTLKKAQRFYDDVYILVNQIDNQQFKDEIRLICFAIVVESTDNLYYKQNDNEDDSNKKIFNELHNELLYRILLYLQEVRSSRNLVNILLEYYNNQIVLSTSDIMLEYKIFLQAGNKPNYFKTDDEIRRILPKIEDDIVKATTIGELNRNADECEYNNKTQKWDVTFNNGKTYSYANENVEKLTEPESLNPNMYRISREGRKFFDIKEIYVFKSSQGLYWHICFGNGREGDYPKSDLDITESCLMQSQSANVFEYIKQIADLITFDDENANEKLLSKRFDKISFVGNDVALAKYLNPSLVQGEKRRRECTPIFPFGCNNSQYRAVKNALENQISVIQGPPGTGKTQTILNIIANILMQGKTVQIVSNNNSATENVYEKLSLPQYDLGFVAAILGSSENKKIFIEQQDTNYPDFSTWKTDENSNDLQKRIAEQSEQLKIVFDKQEKLACLKQELSQLVTEQEYFDQYVEESDVNIDRIEFKKKLSSKDWMVLWQEYQLISEEKKLIRFWFKIKNFFKYGVADWSFYRQDISKIITTFQAMYYRAKRSELSAEITGVEKYLNDVNKNLLDDLCNQSMIVLKDKLARKYEKNNNRKIFNEDDLWKEPYDVLKEYPVILSTTFSSRNSLNTDVIYDYLIMDEASQVDVATGALALSCARNVVIVGDTKQLPNIVGRKIKLKAEEIFDRFNISEGYQYTKSFLQSMLDVMPNVTQTLLREHYRCHPKIINFCNQKFYHGELIIMTTDHGEEDVLSVVKTVEGNHERDHYSQRQIDVIKNEIIPKYDLNSKETGIITPYRNQVKALEREITDIDAATVHKFQGKEMECIIISTVDDEISDFTDDPYLINVAVSRAKKKLMLVVTGNKQSKERNITDLIDYIEYNNFEVVESKIYSIFDYLYKQYTEARKAYLQKHKKISAYDSENLMYSLIEDILSDSKYSSLDVVCHFPLNMLIKNPEFLSEEECRYAMNPATHLDFLIYNRISKKPVLAIEVDGYEYHKKHTVQASRDLLKNRIMELYEIPLLRFMTNGSGEKEKIIEMLEQRMGQ